MNRFESIRKINLSQRYMFYSRFFGDTIKKDIDQKMCSLLIKLLETDIKDLEKANYSLDTIVFNVLAQCVEDENLVGCDIFSTYLEKSEKEKYRKLAEFVKDNILHKEKPEEIIEILEHVESGEYSITDETLKDGDASVEEHGIEPISSETKKIINLFENGNYLGAKSFIHRMKENPNKYRAYSIEFLRMQKDLALKNAEEFRTTSPRVAEQLEKKVSEYERLAIEATRLLATQKEPLEDELLPLVMKNAILEPEDKNLAENFALRYLKEPTCFRSIEKEAICVMLVRLYKNQGDYDKIVGLLETLMSGLNSSNRTSTLNSYERELLKNLGEAYLIQSKGKLSKEDVDKLTTFVNNFSNVNNPNHIRFLGELIEDLKKKEAQFSVDVVNFSIIKQSTVATNDFPIPPPPVPPVVSGKYPSELSLEKRIEYIAQKELSLGFDAQGMMSLDEDTFTGYMLIKWVSPDGEKVEPFYHVEKLFDITQMPLKKRTEALQQLRKLKENNPNIDLYTLRDIAVNQIGIPEAYGAATYLIQVGDGDDLITSELGDLAAESKLIEKFEEASQEILTLPEDKRIDYFKKYRVLKYNHTTGSNASNPVWYEKTNRAYDAFRSLSAAASGMVYNKSQEEENFEYESRNSRVKAYTSNPNLNPTLVKIYLLINALENSRYNYIKMEQELIKLENELNLISINDVELVAEADVIIQRIGRIYKSKYNEDIFTEVSKKTIGDDEEWFFRAPKSEEESKTKSDILEEYDTRYKTHKETYSKKITNESVELEGKDDQEKKKEMIRLLEDYLELSYRESQEYRSKILAYINMKSALKNNKNFRRKVSKEIDALKSGKATVDPITGEIIKSGIDNQPSVLPANAVFEPPHQKTGTDR